MKQINDYFAELRSELESKIDTKNLLRVKVKPKKWWSLKNRKLAKELEKLDNWMIQRLLRNKDWLRIIKHLLLFGKVSFDDMKDIFRVECRWENES